MSLLKFKGNDFNCKSFKSILNFLSCTEVSAMEWEKGLYDSVPLLKDIAEFSLLLYFKFIKELLP